MDLSKLPDSQRQQLEQLQKQFQEHQQKQQQSAAAAAATTVQPPAYNPSQVHHSYDPSQAYNQSYYYNYQDASQPQQPPHQQYDTSYYQNYYSNAYQQHQYTPRGQQRNEGPGSVSLGLGHVHDSYGPPLAAGGHYGQGHFRSPIGQSPYNGGGRRGGGRSFRPPNTGGSGPPFHGRGHCRGRGRGPPVGASSLAHANTPQQQQPAPRCELCQVDCTSKEILEQHNIGKRHKKNLQKSQSQKDENTLVQENNDNNQETKPPMKRKKKGGSGRIGAKRQRQVARGGPRIPPKVVIPLMCDLCNIKCDTREVFDRHTAGKKHMAKLKRYESHQAMYGPTTVQALYPPNPLSQTLGNHHQPAVYYGATNAYTAPPPESYNQDQNSNPNPQLADAPLEFATRIGVQ